MNSHPTSGQISRSTPGHVELEHVVPDGLSDALAPLQIVRPAALLGGLRQGRYDKIVTGGEQKLKLAIGIYWVRLHLPQQWVLVGRRLADHRAVRRTL